jgi:hypothetical protein
MWFLVGPHRLPLIRLVKYKSSLVRITVSIFTSHAFHAAVAFRASDALDWTLRNVDLRFAIPHCSEVNLQGQKNRSGIPPRPIEQPIGYDQQN